MVSREHLCDCDDDDDNNNDVGVRQRWKARLRDETKIQLTFIEHLLYLISNATFSCSIHQYLKDFTLSSKK